ncbi:transglycosylase SLT domain-containing protein [Paracraurococcus lichenis]|uniref:Transglycosylase SLT domain-containing protein n=1 Tax=Paracraurococcus lichenis TaxID=3064888 RepID=A0ABT9EA04_9PROT|nr:transglycosylase SLT domain-containing protein [Paracraurococcus sp. LOR1-02]MDO9713032.1 transglycosylase SLT domain-containing protein [Paracraurococcus sp. LOR1-02]
MPLPILPSESAATGRTEQLGRYTAGTEVISAIRSAAAATGIGFDTLAAKAAVESGFRPNAQARSSSARGLFQFVDQTWLDMVRRKGAEHGLGEEAAAITRGAGGRLTVADPALRSRILGLRDDPEISARMAGEYLRDISDSLTPTLGRRPDAAELYLGHFLGAGGARQALQALAANPAQPASAVLPEAAAANPMLFRAADGSPLTVSGFMEGIRTRLARAYAEIGATPPEGPVSFQSGTGDATQGLPTALAGVTGTSTPARVAHAAERAMTATLAKVFNRLGHSLGHGLVGHGPGRGLGYRQAARGASQALPPEVLAALRTDTRTARG